MRKYICTIFIFSTIFLISFLAIETQIDLLKSVEASQVTLIAGGDVEWSRLVKRKPEIYFEMRNYSWWERFLNKRLLNKIYGKLGFGKRDFVVPYIVTPHSINHLQQKFDLKLEDPKQHHNSAIQYGIEFDSTDESMHYPLKRIQSLLSEADIAFVNLETPLSDHSRYVGDFRTPTVFAKALEWAGVDVVATANNHALDCEGGGLIETRQALSRSDIGVVGTGMDLSDARQPYIIERNGISVAFLGYSQHTNFGRSSFALEYRSGVVPLDPFLIEEDIQRLREQVDFIILSFHWGIENTQDIHSRAKDLAHTAIDAGADVILGHGPHVPTGIELYKSKIIIYSMGNFIFGHNHEYWMDNYLARLTFSSNKIEKVEVIPIAGKGINLAQPYRLKGEPARKLLKNIQILTEELDTRMKIDGDLGIIAN